jgi:hypothetical protein
MTVCLTGDVHHESLDTRDQEYLTRTELECAIECATIAEEYGVPVTLFVTGKAAREEPDRFSRLVDMEHIEIGGHNYWAFETLAHTGSRALLGSWNGPRWFQDWEIQRTIQTFTDFGVDISSWRDHAYRHDGNTAELLSTHGVTHFSDAVGPEQTVEEQAGLVSIPINTPPDHEHVYHAFRTPEFVKQSDFEGPFGSESYEVAEWEELVREYIRSAVEKAEPATILAHPSCMQLADGLEAFEQLCAHIADRYRCVKMGQLTLSNEP